MRSIIFNDMPKMEIIYIHGCRVEHDIVNNTYKYFVGDVNNTVIETTSESDMAYKINCMQSYPSGI